MTIGYDGNKKIKGAECTARQALEFNSREPGGRRRVTLVDTLGLLIMVRVVVANVPECQGVKQLLFNLDYELLPALSEALIYIAMILLM